MSECGHRFFPCTCGTRDPSDCRCDPDAGCRIREDACDHPDADQQMCWCYQEHRADEVEKDAERLAGALSVQGLSPIAGVKGQEALRAHEARKEGT